MVRFNVKKIFNASFIVFFLFTHLLPIIHAPQVNKKKINSVWEEKLP